MSLGVRSALCRFASVVTQTALITILGWILTLPCSADPPGAPVIESLELIYIGPSKEPHLKGLLSPADERPGVTLTVNVTAIKDGAEHKNLCIPNELALDFSKHLTVDFDFLCPGIPVGTDAVKLRYTYTYEDYRGHVEETTVKNLKITGTPPLQQEVSKAKSISRGDPVLVNTEPLSTIVGAGSESVSLKKIWSRTFDGVPYGVGSPDGNVNIIDTKPDEKHLFGSKERFILVSNNDKGEVLFRKSISLSFAADPDWEKILLFTESEESIEKRNQIEKRLGDDAYKSMPPAEMKCLIIDRTGNMLHQYNAPNMYARMIRDAIYFEIAGDEIAGPLTVRKLPSGEEIRIGDYDDNRYYIAPGGKGFFIGIGHFTMLDNKGTTVFTLTENYNRTRDLPAMFGEYLILDKGGPYAAAYKNSLQYSLINGSGDLVLEFIDQGYEGTYEKNAEGKVTSASPHPKFRAIAVSPDGKTGVVLTATQHLIVIDMENFQLQKAWDISSSGVDAFRLKSKQPPPWVETMDAGHLRVQDGNAFILGRSVEAISPRGKFLNDDAWKVYLVVVNLDGRLESITSLDGQVINAKFSGPDAKEIVAWTKTSVDKYVINGLGRSGGQDENIGMPTKCGRACHDGRPRQR